MYTWFVQRTPTALTSAPTTTSSIMAAPLPPHPPLRHRPPLQHTYSAMQLLPSMPQTATHDQQQQQPQARYTYNHSFIPSAAPPVVNRRTKSLGPSRAGSYSSFSHTQPLPHSYHVSNDYQPYEPNTALSVASTESMTPSAYGQSALSSQYNTSQTLSVHGQLSPTDSYRGSYASHQLVAYQPLHTQSARISTAPEQLVQQHQTTSTVHPPSTNTTAVDVLTASQQHLQLLLELMSNVRHLALNDDDTISGTVELSARLNDLAQLMVEHRLTLVAFCSDTDPAHQHVRSALAEVRQTLLGGRVLLNRAADTSAWRRRSKYKPPVRVLLNDVIVITAKLGYALSIALITNTSNSQNGTSVRGRPTTTLRPGQEQCLLGDKYAVGHGVTKDYAKALEYYEESARLNYSPACVHIGNMLSASPSLPGVARDAAAALRAYQQAAKLNNLEAINILAQYYESGGLNLKKSLDTAVSLYQTAANGGNADAITNLGHLYECGAEDDQSFIPVDIEAAQAWYTLAATKYKHAKALNNLAALFYRGAIGADSQGQPDYHEAYKYFSASAKQGNAVGECNLAVLLELGHGCEKDVAGAMLYYASSAKQGQVSAMIALGCLYLKQQQYQPAYHWLHQAVDRGDGAANYHIARMYAQGLHVEKSDAIAFEFYQRAIQIGAESATTVPSSQLSPSDAANTSPFDTHKQYPVYYADALLESAHYLYAGRGCQCNPSLAFQHFSRAASAGELPDAYYCMAVCYELSEGTTKSHDHAIANYQRAATMNHADAHYSLSLLYRATDPAESERLLQRAYELGSLRAKVEFEQRRVRGKGQPALHSTAMLQITA